MDQNKETEKKIIPSWIFISGLVLTLYLMYSPTFLVDYLMRDEWEWVGLKPPPNLIAPFANYFYRSGRGLFGVFQIFVIDFAGYATSRIQAVRFVSFVSLSLMAVILYLFLKKQTNRPWIAFFAVLLFMSQPAMQLLMGYSFILISGTLPSIWLSYCSFYLYFYGFESRGLPKYAQLIILFVLLVLAMQAMQTFAFFALIPTAFLALTDWDVRKKRIIELLIVSLLVYSFSVGIYKYNLDHLTEMGRTSYKVGQQGVDSLFEQPLDIFLFAIDPRVYYSVFKMWTYPYPFQNTSELSNLTEKILSAGVMIVWMGFLLASFFVELRGKSRPEFIGLVMKWMSVMFCLGIAATFVIADSPGVVIDHRPHVLFLFSGLVVVTWAYAVHVLVDHIKFMQSPKLQMVVGILLLWLVVGAQSDIIRNVVLVQARQLDFIRFEMTDTNLTSYQTIIVKLPRNDTGCISEPCGPWYGVFVENKGHLAKEAVYRYTLSTLGKNPADISLVFVEYPSNVPDIEGSIVVDWNHYVATEENYAKYFRLINP